MKSTRWQESLEVFQFDLGDYHFGVDISTLRGIRNIDEMVNHDGQNGFFSKGEFHPFTLLELDSHLQLLLTLKETPKILLMEDQEREYGVLIYNPQGIINFNIQNLFSIPLAVKPFISPALWAVGVHQKKVILIANLLTFFK